MALSRELTRHLTDEDNQPLPKRLKLAENAFTSLDLLLGHKEDFILNWLCEVSKQTNDINTWHTLKKCLDFQNVHLHSSTMNTPVKAAIIETLMNSLKSLGELELTRVIIRCYQSTLSNREMHRYLVYKPIHIVELLDELLTCSLTQSFINCHDDISKLPELSECVIDSLNLLIECHRRASNKTQLTTHVTECLVYKLCVLSEQIANDKVTSTAIKCIQRFIFDKSIDTKVFESENWAHQLFSTLFRNTKNIFNNNNTALVISCIFHAAVLTFKSSVLMIDVIYRSILNSTSISTLKLQICSDLFEKLNDITLDINNKINETTLVVYYHGIIDEILALDHLDESAYSCLDGMAKFNPLIIESKLQDVFKKILLVKKPTNTIKSLYVNLMTDILNACIRLRRENKLVPWILMAINDSLHTNHDHETVADDILPREFTNKFTLSINNMTNALAVDVLMSFIYHLDVCNSQSPESETLYIMMDITSRLIIAFLEGVHVFDYSTPLTMQRKFVDGLIKLGKVLEKLAKIVSSPINKHETTAFSILSVINCWQRIIAFIKNYAPDSLTEENSTSIIHTINSIHRKINRIHCNLAVIDNNVMELLNLCRLEKNRIDGNTQLDGNEIVNDIENNWMILMDNHSYVISNLNDCQLYCLARVILSNVYDSKTETLQTKFIKSPIVQQNKKLITALIFESFVAIASEIKNSSSTTNKLLTGITTAKNSLEDERAGKILKLCKKLLLDPQWAENKFSITIEQYLKVLLLLPLVHLTNELKTIIFMVIFSMTKEWTSSQNIIDLSYEILSDISEDSNIDILQYINLQCFIEELSKYSLVSKILECSLRNIDNYDSIATFIKDHNSIEDCAVPTVIDCIEKIKSRLKPDERIIARKIEKKWCKRVMNSVKCDAKNPHQVKNLRVAFKVAIALKKIDTSMLQLIHSTVLNIFQINDKDEEHPKLQCNFLHNDTLIIDEGLQIIKILLQSALKRNDRVNETLNNDIIKRTWSLVLAKQYYDIVPDLLDAQRTTPKILKKVLNLLLNQTIDAHNQQDKLLFENSMKIWCCVAHVDMPTSSNYIRQLYLQQLIQCFDTLSLSNDDCLIILKLCTIIVNSKRVNINEKIIDLIFLRVQHFFINSKNISAFICDEMLTLSLAFVTYRINIITDRLPILLQLYRKVIRFIIDKSKCKDNLYSENELRCLALNVKKVAIALVKLKKDMGKVSPYLIADLIEMYSQGVIPDYVKEPLDDCIGIFLSNCDHHAIPLLFRALPPAMQEIFKTLYETYNKFYKFTGKI